MRVSSIFGFTDLPVTTVVCVFYVAIFAVTIGIHEYGWSAPAIGEKKLGLDLEAAAKDLQVIARLPHPFNSPRSDVVHDYILSRVQQIAAAHPGTVEFVNDLVTNITFLSTNPATETNKVVYFEGNNVLAKIEGTLPGLPAVLLNAHFDSVSTAPGATDDGMGATTIIALLRYFAENKPERTLIFCLNNAEEDGLYGAYAFMGHPWSSLPRTFLNLEGLGEGGRPLFFRTSSPRVTRALSYVSHPHANSISVDAFTRWRLIRSGTDYQVFDANGMQGLDLTFYKWRAMYHTRGDSVAGLGGIYSLWTMMENSLEATFGLMADYGADEGGGGVTYFDVLGLAIAIFDLTTVFAINIGLLVGGPLLVGLLLWFSHIHRKAAFPLKGWFRFPVAFVLSTSLTLTLGVAYRYLNPFIMHSSSYVVAISLLSTAYLTQFLILGTLSYFRPVHQQKLIVLIELYVLFWIMLAVATGFENPPLYLVSVYWVTLFSAGSLSALVLALLESIILESVGTPPRTEVLTLPAETNNGHFEEGEEPTETTALIPGAPPRNDAEQGEQQIPAFWLLQFALVLVFPVIWASQTSLLLMSWLGQTIIDGSDPLIVYLSLAILCLLIIFPAAPFIHKLHSSIAIILLLVLAASTASGLLSAPFTATWPFKIYFQQTLDLDARSNRVSLVGMPGIIKPRIAPALPDAWGKNVSCTMNPTRPGLQMCSWDSDLVPNVNGKGTGDIDGWVHANVTRTGTHSARIEISGTETRMCKLDFSRSVNAVSITGASTSLLSPSHPVPNGGISTLSLWSRVWEKEFLVDISWEGSSELSGRVACGWADMSSGKIPALDEVIEFLPLWVIMNKLSESLVEVGRSFSVPPVNGSDMTLYDD